jgi:hypothetical protein
MTDTTQLEINREVLPFQCAHIHPLTGRCIVTQFGESGYYENEITRETVADEYNKARNISPAQREAHYFGSMFAWDLPAANPDRYTETGHPLPLTPRQCAMCENPAETGYNYCQTCAAEIGAAL